MVNDRLQKWIPIISLSLVATALTGVVRAQHRQISQEEIAEIISILEIGPGDLVVDFGAGSGALTVELARKVTEEGHVFSTEVNPERLKDIRERVTEAGLANVSIVWGSQNDTGLPPDCCDAILLRRVYHHVTDPEAMLRGLSRAARNGALLAVLDSKPEAMKDSKQPEGVPANRGGHGMPKRLLIEEMKGAGFELVREVEPWHGRDYCVLFRSKSTPKKGT